MSDLADLRDREHAHITNRTEPYSGHIFDVIEDDIELASTRVSMRRLSSSMSSSTPAISQP